MTRKYIPFSRCSRLNYARVGKDFSFLTHNLSGRIFEIISWHCEDKLKLSGNSFQFRVKHRRSKVYRSANCVDDRGVIAMESIIHDPLNLETALFRRVIGISAYLLAHSVFQRRFPRCFVLARPLPSSDTTFFTYTYVCTMAIFASRIKSSRNQFVMICLDWFHSFSTWSRSWELVYFFFARGVKVRRFSPPENKMKWENCEEGKCEQYDKIIIQDIQAWWTMLQKVLTL